jgi:hypothetical protein
VVRRSPVLVEHRHDDDQLLSESLGGIGERRRRPPSLPWVRGVVLYATLPSFVLGAIACGDPSVESAGSVASSADPVIRGHAVEEGDFRAVVSLGGCTGTLVHPAVVVYADHCGTAMASVRFGSSAETPERVVAVDHCRSLPGAKLGDGTDLAFCVLAERVLEIEPERIMAGCELEDLAVGTPVTFVGFGVDRERGSYGEKRYGTSRIASVGDELILEPGGADTCRGDSGGPVFVSRVEPDGTVQRRLVGVTSAGTDSECGEGVGHYVNVTAKLDWLESASNFDLSPCFSAGTWSPTPACAPTTSSDAAGARTAQQRDRGAPSPEWLASCGDAFDPAPDEEPPVIEWTSPSPRGAHFELPAGSAFAELELAVQATDVGWGVQQVTFTLLDERGHVLFERVDEAAPYGVPIFRLPPGRFTLAAEAVDFAGHATSARATVLTSTPMRAAGGCGVSRHGAEPLGWLASLLALMGLSARRSARSRVRPP